MVRKILLSCLFWAWLGAKEIAQEEHLQIGALGNGVAYWIQKHPLPEHMTAVRVVWKAKGKSLSYGTEIPYADCGELQSFFEFCRGKIDPESEALAVIAVGDFQEEEVYGAFDATFCDASLSVLSQENRGISIETSSNLDHVEISLRYPTPLPKLETFNDMRRQWAAFFLQTLLVQRVQETLQVNNAASIPNAESRFCLPMEGVEVRARCGFDNYLKVLSTYLAAIGEIEKQGFSGIELAGLKAKAQKRLESTYRDQPDSNHLAGYYAELFGLGTGSPTYTSYFELSKKAIAEVSLVDIQELLTRFIREDARQIEILGPLPILDVRDQIMAVASGAVPVGIFDNDPFAALPITDEERGHLRSIIDTMANTSTIMLPFYKDQLEDLGRRINHVHPLRFIGTIFADPYLKQCMATVRDSYFKWRGFLDGFSRRIEEEHSRDNVLPYILGFCKLVKADPDQVRILIQKRNWEGFVLFLIEGKL